MPKFTFANSEDGFDAHIAQSIRGYENLSADILKFSEYFIEDGTTVVDIGCSSGRLLKAMHEQNKKFAPKCLYRGIESEEDFFSELQNQENLSFDKLDVREFDWESLAKSCCLVISMFTLQFIPKRDRQRIIDLVYESLVPGGAFIFSEKILSETSQIEEMMTFCYYDWKKNTFSADEILKKESELRHMMKPLRLRSLLNMIKASGFSSFQTFWQNYNFVAIIAIKH